MYGAKTIDFKFKPTASDTEANNIATTPKGSSNTPLISSKFYITLVLIGDRLLEKKNPLSLKSFDDKIISLLFNSQLCAEPTNRLTFFSMSM